MQLKRDNTEHTVCITNKRAVEAVGVTNITHVGARVHIKTHILI